MKLVKSTVELKSYFFRLEREIDMMQALKHPHIVNLIDFFVGKNYIFLVMELCKGGDLNDYLNERGRPMSVYSPHKFCIFVFRDFLYSTKNRCVFKNEDTQFWFWLDISFKTAVDGLFSF